MNVIVMLYKDKSKNSLRSFLKPCTKLIRNFNLFPRTTNSSGKSKVRKVGKFLITLDARQSRRKFPTKTNALGETLCVFINIVLET